MNEKKNALRKVVSILIILAIALAMPVAQAYAALQVTRRSVVYAKDANSHVAIQGASIYLDGVSIGTTDSKGGLVIAGAYTGPHQLSVGKDGYNTYQTTIDINSTFTVYLTTSPPATLVYSTDFEQVTKKDANRLNMGIENWFEFGGVGGATMWLEGLDRKTVSCHSGARCVGMELTDITKSRRAQFGIYPGPLVGNEYFVSVWLLLPADWGLHAPNINWNWYEIVNPYYNGSDAPYTAVWINQPDITQSKFDVEVGGRNVNVEKGSDVFSLDKTVNFSLPRGRWFNIKFDVLRDAVNGALKVWVDDKLVSDRHGLAIALTTLKVVVGKIYYETTDTTPHRIWVDDLEIWDGLSMNAKFTGTGLAQAATGEKATPLNSAIVDEAMSFVNSEFASTIGTEGAGSCRYLPIPRVRSLPSA